jgi:type I restriction enzyme S subunit
MTWPCRRFLQLVEDVTGGSVKIQKKDYLDQGDIPIIDQGLSTIAGYTNAVEDTFAEKLPVVIFGDHTRIVKFVDYPFVLGADGVKILSPKKELDAKFLYHYLSFIKIPNHGYSRHYKFLKEITIPHPSLSEQRRIVNILDQADCLRKLRSQADTKTERIISALFTNMFGNSAMNQKKLPIVRLGDKDIAEINPRFPANSLSDDAQVSFVPMADVDEVWGRIKGIQSRSYADVKKGFTPFCEGDVLFAKITPCMQNGKAAIARKLINGLGFGSTEFHVLRPGLKATAEWLYGLVRLKYFRNSAMQAFSGSAGQQRVPTDFLKEYSVPLPPLEQQHKFAEAVNDILKHIENTEKSGISIDLLFNNLLHRAFSGDLTATWREAHMKELLAEMEVQAKALND